MSEEKKLYLVAYDYGMGGLWGTMLARSEAEITAAYPELAVAHDQPPWMTDETYNQIYSEDPLDIDDQPSGILNGIMAARAKKLDGLGTSSELPPSR